MVELTPSQRQLMELWHNIYRMHGYVEMALGGQLDGVRPDMLKQADQVLRASFERVKSTLPAEWVRYLEHTEKPPEIKE